MANALANGGTLKLGDAKYDQIEITFDKDKLGKDATGTVVGVKDLLDADGNLKVDDKSLAEMVARISKAANGSSTFTVGAGSSDKMISLTEKLEFSKSSAAYAIRVRAIMSLMFSPVCFLNCRLK